MPEALPVVPERLVHRCEVPGPRYAAYPPPQSWSALSTARYGQVLEGLRGTDDEFALYVHFPFCAKRCLYCGCHSLPTSRTDRIDRYLDDLTRELDLVVQALGRGARVRRLHWGGGTPNLLTATQLDRALAMITERFALLSDAELSLDADPRQVSALQLRQLRARGFTHVSYGVQDLDPAVQRAIGRIQPLEIVRDAFTLARGAGFRTINVDLICGLPRQTIETVDETLTEIIALRPDRIACFSYSHVPAERPHQRAIPEKTLPGAVGRVTLFRHVVDRLAGAGYAWIGLDHFALVDDPLAVAQREGTLGHDTMGFTTRPAPHHLGFGMSAISEVGGIFAQNAVELGPWTDAVQAGTLPVARGHELTEDDRRRGTAMRALLCTLELPFAMADGALQPALEALKAYEASGMISVEPDRVRVTPLGRFFLRALCLAFDPDAEALV
jgi:oxygen-independent coproporphyrinogen-3 oxidase